VWLLVIIAQTYTVNEDVWSSAILAVAMSVPDLVTNVIVAREGHGEMMMSSALGSNIFASLMTLSFEWLVEAAIVGSGSVEECAGPTVTEVALVAVATLALLVTTFVFDCKLTRLYGSYLIIIYVVCLTLIILVELHTLPVWKSW
jgi:Ca2+/Na+ antiporter